MIDDVEFVPSERKTTGAQAILLLGVVLVVAFFAWSYTSELDIVSMTAGEVAPSSKLKTVQHLEGGIVKEILVREGEKVSAGQALVVLEPTATGADVGELRVRLAALRADVARLEALSNGTEAPDIPAELENSMPDIAEQARRRFKAQFDRHRSELARQQQAITQRLEEISEINSRIESSRNSLKFVREQIRISDALMADNLSNRFEHLELLKERAELEGAIETNKRALASAISAHKEAKAQLVALVSVYQDQNAEDLDEARRSYQQLYERIQKFEDSLARTVVRSPVEGILKVLYVATLGGVLKAGDAVVDIVPVDDRLVVDAQLPTQDIGYVRIGQAAVVKLASADAMRFGNINGKVVRVSPDTLQTPDGRPYYQVRIEPEQTYFEHGGLRYDLFPGMQVMASIQTGKRTVLQYLLDPLRGYASSSMQER